MALGQFQATSSISSNTDTSVIEDGAGGTSLLRKSGATVNDRTFEWYAMDGMAIHGVQLSENTALNAETSTSSGTASYVINVGYEVR